VNRAFCPTGRQGRQVQGMQIAIGTGMIMLTTFIHVAGLIGLASALPRLSQ